MNPVLFLILINSLDVNKSGRINIMQSMIKCNKFIPQAFNNNKCQNCFIYKDNHTTEALIEYSKVSGYY